MQTALGVAGGMMIANAITSAFESETAHAAEPVQDDAPADDPQMDHGPADDASFDDFGGDTGGFDDTI